MQISIRGFLYHKVAESFIDCFDRYGISQHTNKFSISDGVSKSFFPGIWAEILIQSFLKDPNRILLSDKDLFKEAQEKWTKKVNEIVNEPDQKYFIKNFFAEGRSAAATFVGLHFYKENNILKWEALALGDSFLFFIPKDNYKGIEFLSSKKDLAFNNFPDFFDSRSSINKGKIKIKQDKLKSGTFYLMTDALSEWFINQRENAIEIISKWKTQKDFENSIQELRKAKLHNDDSAILIIELEDDNISEFNYRHINISDYYQLVLSEDANIDKRITESEMLSRQLTESNKNEHTDIALNEPKSLEGIGKLGKDLETENSNEEKNLDDNNFINIYEKDELDFNRNLPTLLVLDLPLQLDPWEYNLNWQKFWAHNQDIQYMLNALYYQSIVNERTNPLEKKNVESKKDKDSDEKYKDKNNSSKKGKTNNLDDDTASIIGKF